MRGKATVATNGTSTLPFPADGEPSKTAPTHEQQGVRPSPAQPARSQLGFVGQPPGSTFWQRADPDLRSTRRIVCHEGEVMAIRRRRWSEDIQSGIANQRASPFGDVHRPQRATGNRGRIGAPRHDQVDRPTVHAPRRIADVVGTFRAEGQESNLAASYIEKMERSSSDHMVALTLGALSHKCDSPAIGRPCRLVVRLGSGGKTIDETRRYVEPPEPGMARTLRQRPATSHPARKPGSPSSAVSLTASVTACGRPQQPA